MWFDFKHNEWPLYNLKSKIVGIVTYCLCIAFWCIQCNLLKCLIIISNISLLCELRSTCTRNLYLDLSPPNLKLHTISNEDYRKSIVVRISMVFFVLLTILYKYQNRILIKMFLIKFLKVDSWYTLNMYNGHQEGRCLPWTNNWQHINVVKKYGCCWLKRSQLQQNI